MNLLTGRRAVLALWAMVLVVVGVMVTVGKPGKLYRTFVTAGAQFRHGTPLYGPIPDDLDQYRYSPLVAAACVPWSLLPTTAGALAWRWLQALALLWALREWSRCAVPTVSWPALALLALPLSIGNFHNAQVNPLVAALMLLGGVAFARERYWLAAAAIAGATLFKIYPLSLGLLLCIVEPRRFGWRLFTVLGAAALLPFALQSPDYVCRQSIDWFERLGGDDRSSQPLARGYHDFQRLLLRWGVPISLATYRAGELVIGGVAGLIIFCGRRCGWERSQLVQAALGLAFFWCTLFGPATESATYMLLAPFAAHAVLAVTGQPLWERCWVRLAYVLLLSLPIMQWFPRPIVDAFRGATIPQAHAALMLVTWFLFRLYAPTSGVLHEDLGRRDAGSTR